MIRTKEDIERDINDICLNLILISEKAYGQRYSRSIDSMLSQSIKKEYVENYYQNHILFHECKIITEDVILSNVSSLNRIFVNVIFDGTDDSSVSTFSFIPPIWNERYVFPIIKIISGHDGSSTELKTLRYKSFVGEELKIMKEMSQPIFKIYIKNNFADFSWKLKEHVEKFCSEFNIESYNIRSSNPNRKALKNFFIKHKSVSKLDPDFLNQIFHSNIDDIELITKYMKRHFKDASKLDKIDKNYISEVQEEAINERLVSKVSRI